MRFISTFIVFISLLPKAFAEFELPRLSSTSHPEFQGFAEQTKALPQSFTPVVVRSYTKGEAAPAKLWAEPYIYAGRLEMKRGNSSGSCTAQFVGHQRMLLTAAHCVFGYEPGGTWVDDVKFTRVYGDQKAETYGWECIAVPKKWVNGKSFSHDYAWIRVDRDGPTYLGFVPDFPDDFVALGYPVNYGGTRVMYKVNGTLGSRSPTHGLASMVANVMLNGSSGGAWLNYDNQVIGLNSFTWDSRPNVMYSPLFTSEVLSASRSVLDGTPNNDLVFKCK